MTENLQINNEYIMRAGKEMIARHGESALVRTNKQINICESEGFHTVAEIWKLIRESIKHIQQSNSTIKGYKKALNKGVFLSG